MEDRAPQLPGDEQTDIFLCTRELPDRLTAETSALRQLCAALAGEGWKVFFPSNLPRELTDEQRAERIVAAVRSARVMVAAGVGREGLTDMLSRGLWGAFLKSGEDAANRFFLCWRDQEEEPLPVILEGKPLFDMSDLRFLTDLKAALAKVLPPPVARETPEADPEEAPAETPEEVPEVISETPDEPKEAGENPAEPEEVPEETPEAPEEAPAEAPPEEKKPFPWKWVLLGAAVLALVLWLIFK